MKSEQEFLHGIYKKAKETEQVHKRYSYRAATVLLVVGVMGLLGLKTISGDNRNNTIQYEARSVQRGAVEDNLIVEGLIINKDEEGRVLTIHVKSCKNRSLPTTIECNADKQLFESFSEGDSGTFQVENRNGSYQIIGKQ